MNDPAKRPGSASTPDAVTDAVLHGLLAAAARRHPLPAPVEPVPPDAVAPTRPARRRFLVAALASAAAVVIASVLPVPSPARADAILDQAIASCLAQKVRAYDVGLRSSGDHPVFVELDGRVFLVGGESPRMVAALLIGPLRRPVRFGVDSVGGWVETLSGVVREPQGTPLLSARLGGLDDRLLRLETFLQRARAGYRLEVVSLDDDRWRVTASRKADATGQPVAAEFIARKRDGVITSASATLHGPLGGLAMLSFELIEGMQLDERELEPQPHE